MQERKTLLYTRFFEENKNMFDSNTKKAWFMLGVVWENAACTLELAEEEAYKHRSRYTGEGNTFDKDTFIKISNECHGLLIDSDAEECAYDSFEFNQDILSEAGFLFFKALYDEKMSNAEAQYYFLTGIRYSYIPFSE